MKFFNEMDDDTKLWSVFWSCITVIVVAVFTSAALYDSAKNSAIAEMVKAGADPMAVRCAVESDSRDMICMAYVRGAK